MFVGLNSWPYWSYSYIKITLNNNTNRQLWWTSLVQVTVKIWMQKATDYISYYPSLLANAVLYWILANQGLFVVILIKYCNSCFHRRDLMTSSFDSNMGQLNTGKSLQFLDTKCIRDLSMTLAKETIWSFFDHFRPLL